MVLYHDASGVPETPADLLANPPATADFAELVETTRVEGLTSIGTSPFTQDVMVRLSARLDLPSAGSYEFVASGGAQRIVYVNGTPMVGPVALAAGVHDLDARFAVDGTGQLPLEVLLAIDGAPAAEIDSAWLEHDETTLAPVINSMPTLGTSLGGNQIAIEGLGFFPSDQVVVNWGAQQFTDTHFDSIAADEIVLTSPPGSGVIDVTVQTPQGVSKAVSFTYDQAGPVPINFTQLPNVNMTRPTAGTWGPDGIFYVASLEGQIYGIDFDDNYTVLSLTTYPGVSGLSNSDVLGLTTSPFDPPSPVRLYVAHGEHFVNGGTSFTGPSPYTGQVSVLEGPLFDNPVPLVTQLPTSNHDHAVNGLTFDHNGDLLICVGSNTNAGVKHPNSGDLVESPLSAAIVKAETSRPDFNGAITYEFTADGLPSDDQVDGELVDVSDGVHVGVLGTARATPTTWCWPPTGGCTPPTTGPTRASGRPPPGPPARTPTPRTRNEILLVEYGNYYGSPNRNRGRTDARQNIYRNGTEPSIPGEFTQTMQLMNSSMDGVDEYRANHLPGADARGPGGPEDGQLHLPRRAGGRRALGRGPSRSSPPGTGPWASRPGPAAR